MDLNMTVQSFWFLILGLGIVIVAVVAAMLLIIIVSVRRIERAAADIWTVGKQIAANTTVLWQLTKTNETAAAIKGVALDIAAGAGSIDERLSKLPALLGKGS
jgi:heme/copper-type cytochrome/quinol oxidase subunit 2